MPPNAVRQLAGREVQLQVQITQPPMRWKYSYASFAEANALIIRTDTLPVSGLVLLTPKRGDQLLPGHTLIVEGKLEAVEDDPESTFDEYLKQQGAYVSIRRPEFAAEAQLTGGISASLQRYRWQLSRRLGRLYENPDAAALANALTLGVKTELSSEVKDNFRNTGLSHVLALSGMHVSILLLLFIGLERLLIWAGLGLRQPTLLTIGFFWVYLAVTGFTPALSRAVLMLTLLAVPKLLRRDPQLLNSVLAAALVQLSFAPELLFDLGFQFSYLAVIGIVILAPRLNQYLPMQDSLQRWLRDVVTVSFAAQLFLTPLVLLYFQQFPLYFLVANFIIAGIALVATVMSFLTLLLSWLTPVAQAIALMSEQVNLSMLVAAERVSGWQGGLVENVHLPVWGAVALTVFILLFSMSLPLPRRTQPALV